MDVMTASEKETCKGNRVGEFSSRFGCLQVGIWRGIKQCLKHPCPLPETGAPGPWGQPSSALATAGIVGGEPSDGRSSYLSPSLCNLLADFLLLLKFYFFI